MNLYEATLGDRNRIYYLTKFKQFDHRGSGIEISWNWPAFFFSYIWALYRKMYAWFFTYLGFFVLAMYLEITGFTWWPSIAITLVWVAFTVYANSLYYNNIKKKISDAQENVKDDPKLVEHLQHKGGVHRWVIWSSIALTIFYILGTFIGGVFMAMYSVSMS